MSKQDNLHDFLVDIADEIRAKKGTTEKINAQKLSEEIGTCRVVHLPLPWTLARR